MKSFASVTDRAIQCIIHNGPFWSAKKLLIKKKYSCHTHAHNLIGCKTTYTLENRSMSSFDSHTWLNPIFCGISIFTMVWPHIARGRDSNRNRWDTFSLDFDVNILAHEQSSHVLVLFCFSSLSPCGFRANLSPAYSTDYTVENEKRCFFSHRKSWLSYGWRRLNKLDNCTRPMTILSIDWITVSQWSFWSHLLLSLVRNSLSGRYRDCVTVYPRCLGLHSREPISCWTPAHFSSNQIVYANSICWLKGTYYLENDRSMIPHRTQNSEFRVAYYQFVPYILLGMAFLFYLPHMLW